MSILQTSALLGALSASAAAHGYVQGIVAGGIWYEGYGAYFQFSSPQPVVIGWSIPEDLSSGYIDPANYSTPNIICHLDATPAGTSAKVAAGSIVELQWSPWPDSHHGPVLDYLAKCPGKCEDVDKTTLEFFKIDEVGLVDDTTPPGIWGSDQLIANNNSWAVTIPKSIAPGNYVLRHEIIALHSAGNEDGAQNYPQCVNLEITGSGNETPAGTLGTKLYKENDPGILFNIYTSVKGYPIPGPTLIADAVSMKQTEIPINGYAKVTSTPRASSATATSSSTAAVYSTVASSSGGLASYSAPAASSSAVGPASGTSSSYAVYSSSSAGTASGVASYAPPSVSSAAPALGSSSYADHSSSSPSAAPVSSDTCTKQTITITGSSSSSAPSASSAAPISASSSGAPAGYPTTSSAVSALPTSSAYPTGGKSSKPFPEHATLEELLLWFDEKIRQLFREAKHGRDFGDGR